MRKASSPTLLLDPLENNSGRREVGLDEALAILKSEGAASLSEKPATEESAGGDALICCVVGAPRCCC